MLRVESFGFSQESEMEIKLKEFKIKLKRLNTNSYQDFLIINKKKDEKKQKFECELCGYNNKLKAQVRRHFNIVHLKFRLFSQINVNNYSDLRCKLCKKLFMSNFGLRSHEKKNNENDVCIKRLESCEQKKSARVRNIKCKFKRCEKLFISKSGMKIHYKIIHSDMKSRGKFICDLCNYETSLKISLTTHMNSRHLRIRPFKCNFCEYGAFAKSRLRNHVNIIHGQIKEIKCSKCGKVYKTRSGLKSHVMNVHDGIICAFCNRKFWSVLQVKNHIAIEHLNEKGTILCPLCPKKFNIDIQLIEHQKRVHKEKLKCQFKGCQKIFGSKYSRTIHFRRIHLRIKQKVCIIDYIRLLIHFYSCNFLFFLKCKIYICDLCGYNSTCKSIFKSHLYSRHLKIKPFECRMCNFKTSYPRSLNKHYKIIHRLVQLNYRIDLY